MAIPNKLKLQIRYPCTVDELRAYMMGQWTTSKIMRMIAGIFLLILSGCMAASIIFQPYSAITYESCNTYVETYPNMSTNFIMAMMAGAGGLAALVIPWGD